MAERRPMTGQDTGPVLSAPAWTETEAERLAREEGLELTPAHWSVIHFLRSHCRSRGMPCSARLLLKTLAHRYRRQGGKDYLYRLFPGGPVSQACKIAGIPLPGYALDLALGELH